MKYYMQALKLMHKVNPGESLPMMDLEINIGEAFLKQGKAAESIKYLMSAKEIAKNILGSTHTTYAHFGYARKSIRKEQSN